MLSRCPLAILLTGALVPACNTANVNDQGAKVATVVGRLGAPPQTPSKKSALTLGSTKVSSLVAGMQKTSSLAVEAVVLVFEPQGGGEKVRASPEPDGQVVVELPTGTYRVSIEQDPLSPVAYQTETTIEVTEEGASFFLPRVALYSLAQAAKVDACGKKVAIDEATGRFVLGSHLGLVIGDLRDPDYAALIYDERSFAYSPGLLALTQGGERVLAMMSDGIRIYDIAGLPNGTVIDCTNASCFTKQEIPNAPAFPVYHEECWESDRPDFDPSLPYPDDNKSDDSGSGTSNIKEYGGFGGDYSVFHDRPNRVFIVQIGDWTAFIDDQTAEVKRVIAEGGRFQGKHSACDRYVFSYPHDNDLMIRIVDADLQIIQEFDLKEEGIAPTVEALFNGVDDPATGNFLLSLGVLDTKNSVIGALLTLDTCFDGPRTDQRSWPPQVIDVKTARGTFNTTEDLHAGPIDIALHRYIFADSIFKRSSDGSAQPIAVNSRSRVDLAALSANSNPFVAVDARASTYFLFGSSVENAGMAFVHVKESGELLPFVLRLGTEATRHVEVSETAGAVIGITADGRVYWVLYSAALQPDDQINHRHLGEATYKQYHPRCDSSTPCPNNGVCIAENDFVNASGECRPQPLEEATMWCGGLTAVECDLGYECAEMDHEPVGVCVPRTSCDADHACAEGFLCTANAEFFGQEKGYCQEEGRDEICCWPMPETDTWECCGMNGCQIVPQPDWIGGGSQCVKSNGELCGGLHDLPCEADEQGVRAACLMGLMDMPPDVGLCAKEFGEPCHRRDQCAGELICNLSTGTCEAGCQVSADCRKDGGTVSCVFHGGDMGQMCDPFVGLQCANDEVAVAWTGECISETPCDPGLPPEDSGCPAETVCIESREQPGVGICRSPCQLTSDCAMGEVCAVDPWSHSATLACMPAGQEFLCSSCAGDQWCSIPERSCRTGQFCNESHPCPVGQLCQNDAPEQNNTCAPKCQANSDCQEGLICLGMHESERVCALPNPQYFPPDLPACQSDEYLRWAGGQLGCFLAVNEPCSDNDKACPGGMTCNIERGVCVESCSVSSNCADPADQCVAMDSQWYDGPITRYCRAPRAGQLTCGDDYFAYRGGCAKIPSTSCGAGVGCSAGHQCLEQAGDQGLCICSALDTCTACQTDDQCPNGAACNGTTCEWLECPDGLCSNGATCVHWASQSADTSVPSNDPDQPLVIYPQEAICMQPGSSGVGESCTRIDECATLACVYGACTELCTSTADCSGTTGCIAFDPWDWSSPKINYCAEYACNGECTEEEVCWPWANEGQGMCSLYLPCGDGPNDGCDEGFFCDYSDPMTNWEPACKPLCETTADCPRAGDICAELYDVPSEMQGTRICKGTEEATHCVDSEWAVRIWLDNQDTWVCTTGIECNDGSTGENTCQAPTSCVWSGQRDVCACTGSICQQSCTDDSECNSGHPTLMCLDGACRPRPPCRFDSDCPSMTVCGLIDAYEQIGPRCVPPGSQVPGAACDGHADCDSGICVELACAARCQASADCDVDEVCAAVPVAADEELVVGICLSDSTVPECAACTDGEACNLVGECGAGPLCNEHQDCGEGGACIDNLCRVVCSRNDHCGAGEECAGSFPDAPFICVDQSLACDGACDPTQVCLGGVCQPSWPCQQDNDCFDGACVGGQCQTGCSATNDCPGGLECVALRGTPSDPWNEHLSRVCWVPQCDCLDPATWCSMRQDDSSGAHPTCYLGDDCSSCDEGGSGSQVSWCDWDVWMVDDLSNSCHCSALELCGPRCSSHTDCPSDRICDTSSACVVLECSAQDDCPVGTVCGAHPWDWNLRACRVPGDLADGETCYDHSGCASGLCDNSKCKTPCDITSECGEGHLCQRTNNGSPTGTCVAQQESSCTNGCAADAWCYDDGQCHTGIACFQWWEICGSSAQCDGVACRPRCNTSADCSTEEVCAFGVDGMPENVATCLPASDSDCTNGCADDEWCYGAFGQAGQCFSGVPCHSGQWDNCIQGEWCDEIACRLDCTSTSECATGEVCSYNLPSVPWEKAACVPTDLSPCNAGCADGEWCYESGAYGECRTGVACFYNSSVCAEGEVCDSVSCLPQCATTADCLAGEVCTFNAPNAPWGVALCVNEDDAPCSAGCAMDAWCYDNGWQPPACHTGTPCFSEGSEACSANQVCDGVACLSSCNATSDCPQGKECVLREDMAEWPLNGVTNTKVCVEPRCRCHDANDICWVRGDYQTSTDLVCYRAQTCSIFMSCAAQGLDAYVCNSEFGACLCDDPLVCGQECELHADCAAGTVCDATALICIESECQRSSECDAAHSSPELGETVCAYSGDTSQPRTCSAQGEIAIGSPCNDWRECESGMCFANVCVVPCVDNSDCSNGTCQAFAGSPFPICVNPGNPDCSACTESGQFCDGDGFCRQGPACSYDGDCPETEYCDWSSHTCMP